MSRHYEMHITVRGFQKEKEADITAAIENEWNITDSWAEPDGTTYFGEGSLVGGEGEAEFSRRIRNAVWEANDVYCEVEVKCIYLDDPPTEFYTFDEEDYDKWKAAQCSVPPTTS